MLLIHECVTIEQLLVSKGYGNCFKERKFVKITERFLSDTDHCMNYSIAILDTVSMKLYSEFLVGLEQ